MIPTPSPPRPSVRLAILAFAGMGAVYFLSYTLRTAIPGTIFNELQAEFGMSAASVASLGSMFIVIYAWMQLFVGMAADRFGGSRILIFGGLIMALGSIGFPLSNSTWMLYLTRAITGFGASFMYLSVVKEIDLLFPAKRFPMLMGIALTCGYSGGIFAMLPFERVVAAAGWRLPVAGIGLVALVCVFLLYLLLPRIVQYAPVPRKQSLPQSFRPFLEILINRKGWPLLLCAIINFPVYFVVQAAFGKKFLEDVAGLSSPQAASFTMIMMIISASAALTGGFLPGWCGHRRRPVLLATASILFVSALLLPIGILAGAPPWFFLAAFVLMAVPSAAAPASVASMKEVNRPGNAALSIAVVNAVTYLGVSVLVTAVGLILDAFPGTPIGGAIRYPAEAYVTVFAGLALLVLISVVSASRILETNGNNMTTLTTP